MCDSFVRQIGCNIKRGSRVSFIRFSFPLSRQMRSRRREEVAAGDLVPVARGRVPVLRSPGPEAAPGAQGERAGRRGRGRRGLQRESSLLGSCVGERARERVCGRE